MAVNKFATMLNKNTHKLTVTLVYAVLEWILIFLLLLNSFFTYLISKFAKYFGLQPPCLWCSKIDHIFDPQNKMTAKFYADHVCEAHAMEISMLSYCFIHQRLAETHQMCNDCLGSRSGIRTKFALISWVENGDDDNTIVKCSCCDELYSNVRRPHLFFEHSLRFLKHTRKGNVIVELIEDDKNGEELQTVFGNGSFEDKEDFSGLESGLICDIKEDKQDCSVDVLFVRNVDCEFDRLVPLELIDLSTLANHGFNDYVEKIDYHQDECFDRSLRVEMQVREDERDDLELEATKASQNEEINAFKWSLNQNKSEPFKQISDEATTQHSSPPSESNPKAENSPETPTSDDTLNKKSYKSNEMGSEEDHLLSTVEKLKRDLKAERKASNALYSELEQERNASAIAANETMAMINRLQEEKAAMKMESLQYQRMMEEQSEYDQESLQMLNEMIVKRENEKEEVERELEECRKRVLEFEEKEKKKMMISENGSLSCEICSDSCSNFGNVDELSDDDDDVNNLQPRDEHGHGDEEDINLEEIALEYVKQISSLNEPWTEFEEEKLSILDQLDALEERLISLNNKRFDETLEIKIPEEENSISDSMAKPQNEPGLRSEVSRNSRLCVDRKKVSFTEDVDCVYGRQQGLSYEKNGQKSLDGIGPEEENDESRSLSEKDYPARRTMISTVNNIVHLEGSENEPGKALSLEVSNNSELYNSGKKIDLVYERRQVLENQRQESLEMSVPEEQNGMSDSLSEKHYSDKKTMVSMAKSLLPLLYSAENKTGKGLNTEVSKTSELYDSRTKTSFVEEVDHVYDRLQALATDGKFLRDSSSFEKNGEDNKGKGLFQEIFQHLQDLRAIELRVKNLNGG